MNYMYLQAGHSDRARILHPNGSYIVIAYFCTTTFKLQSHDYITIPKHMTVLTDEKPCSSYKAVPTLLKIHVLSKVNHPPCLVISLQVGLFEYYTGIPLSTNYARCYVIIILYTCIFVIITAHNLCLHNIL